MQKLSAEAKNIDIGRAIGVFTAVIRKLRWIKMARSDGFLCFVALFYEKRTRNGRIDSQQKFPNLSNMNTYNKLHY